MKFHKSEFLIRLNLDLPMTNENLCKVSGWIDETNTYGFYKSGKLWHGVDLQSGGLLLTELTRSNCVKWIENNVQRILAAKGKEEIKNKTNEFQNFIKEYVIC